MPSLAHGSRCRHDSYVPVVEADPALPGLRSRCAPCDDATVNGLRDISVISGCGVFLAALMASVASLLERSSGDATNSVVFALVAGLALGFVLTSLLPGQRR